MQCDRAQEFFSDYLEGTLDRPMAVALQAHVDRCADCREELNGLQAVFGALSQVPEVEPPRDGAWQVMLRLRQERMTQWEAERRKAPGFFDWLRSLNPMSAALGAGLATMIIGGTLIVTGVPHVQQGFMPVGGQKLPAPPVAPAPEVTASYGQLAPEGQEVNLQLAVAGDIPDARVRVNGGGHRNSDYTVALQAGVPQPIRVIIPVGNLEPEVVHLSVQSPALGKGYTYLVVLPQPERRQQSVTLNLIDQPLETALKQIASALERPVVSGITEAPVTLQVSDLSGYRALRAVADQLEATVRSDAGVYRLAPHE
jgi:hypothetical protein